MKNINKQSGFTLIELGIVVTALFFITLQVMQNIAVTVDESLVERGSREVVSIQEAALGFYITHNRWPNTLQELIDNNFLPANADVSPHGAPYRITNNGATFSVTVPAGKPGNAQRYRQRVPFAAVAGSNVTSTVTLPGREAAHDALVPRDGSRAWTGAHDAGANNLSNVNTLTATVVWALSNLYAARFYDRNNTSFKLDPNSVSVLNHVRGSIFYDRDDMGFRTDPNGVSILNDVRGSIFYDRDNTGFRTDPNGISYMNDVRASIVYDRDNTAYYSNPASTSLYNDLRANVFYDRTNTSYYVQPKSVSRLNDVRASIVYDRDNTSYYSNPAGTSVFNTINVTRINGIRICAQCIYAGHWQHEVCSTSWGGWSPFWSGMHGDDNDPQHCRFRLRN